MSIIIFRYPSILNNKIMSIILFRYPFNNFLHYHVEHIIISCLESKNPQFVEHLLHDCNLIGRILEAEKSCTLAVDMNKVILLYISCWNL